MSVSSSILRTHRFATRFICGPRIRVATTNQLLCISLISRRHRSLIHFTHSTYFTMAEPLKLESNPTEHHFIETDKSYAAVNRVFVAEVETLRGKFPSYQEAASSDDDEAAPDNGFVLVDTIRQTAGPPVSRAFYRAGRRPHLHFDPSTVRAAIVTCGGLCPGLNNVIRELVHTLRNTYQVGTYIIRMRYCFVCM